MPTRNIILSIMFGLMLIVPVYASSVTVIIPPPQLTPDQMAMVIRDPWYECSTAADGTRAPHLQAQERMAQVLAETGVRWVRLEFFITDVEDPTAELACYDAFITELAPRYGLKVLGLLAFGIVPGVYTPLDAERGLIAPVDPGEDPVYGFATNTYMRTWLDNARRIVSRYGPAVHAYEILNEQNRVIGGGGAGIPAGTAATLHTKFYRFVKQVDRQPDATWRDTLPIIIGGLHPRGTGEMSDKNYVSDREYLRRIYRSAAFTGFANANNGKFPTEGLAYHPYPVEIRLSPQAIPDDIAVITRRIIALRATLEEVADPQLPVWITELGYNVGYRQQTEAGQMEFMRSAFNALGAQPHMGPIFWFKYEDFPGTPAAPENWGIVRIPFTVDTTGACPGGACYDLTGEPAFRRGAYLVFRELAGIANEQLFLSLKGTAPRSTPTP
jgi:hypothetical protein